MKLLLIISAQHFDPPVEWPAHVLKDFLAWSQEEFAYFFLLALLSQGVALLALFIGTTGEHLSYGHTCEMPP